MHGGDLTSVPRVDIPVEGLREAEHVIHVGNLSDIPRIERLVENGCFPEHHLHVGDLTSVPRVDILVERGLARRVVYEVAEVCDGADVPR